MGHRDQVQEIGVIFGLIVRYRWVFITIMITRRHFRGLEGDKATYPCLGDYGYHFKLRDI